MNTDHHRPLAHQRALVTGGARRLGRAIARLLAEQGASVVLHYRSSRQAAQHTADELAARGAEVELLQADLAEPLAARELVARAAALRGPIDILVNSASVFFEDGFADVDRATLDETLQVNALAPLELCRGLARSERADRGRGQVVNLLDTRVTGYDPVHFSYGLSKHLLHTLTRQLALELAPGIRVNAVAPGLVLPPPGKDRRYLQARAPTVPLQTAGDAPDVVRAVRFLLESPFVTGQVIFVDGGAHL
jgi:NAD(P)-dependent dehydrogenase (short-subunit alcohol dehydrogenase family)